MVATTKGVTIPLDAVEGLGQAMTALGAALRSNGALNNS
jgi:hypothetical protein